MSRYGPRIAAIARQADRDRERVAADLDTADSDVADSDVADLDTGDSDVVDPDAATRLLRDGVGRAIGVYVDGRTGGRMVRFSPAELAALERALNDWLWAYAARLGVDADPDVTIREAAELLLQTENVHDVGALLTGVDSDSGRRVTSGTGHRR